MQRRNLDFEIPLTREQWEQLGHSANARPDYGVMRWAPAEFEVIRLAVRAEEAPEGWDDLTPTGDGLTTNDREVARFVYNDGRPFAQIAPLALPATPAIPREQETKLVVRLERWVREKWHELLRESGIHYDRGALPPREPNPPTR